MNLAVDSLAVGSELVRAGGPFEIHAVIRNTGEADMQDASVALWLNDRRVQQRAVTLSAGQRLIVSFSTTLDVSGWVSGRVGLSEDPLLLDNVRWFALSVPSRTRLLIVGQDTPARRALVSIFTSADRNAPYDPVEVAPEAFTQQHAEWADVILLNEQMRLDDRALGWLRDALRRGAGLVVILGPDSDLRDINRRIMPLISSDQFTGLRSATGRDSVAYFTIDRRKNPNPLLAGLLVPGPSSQPQFVDYILTRSSSQNTLLSFTTGDPWIILGEGSAGRGAVLTAGLNPSWGDLAYRGIVVPVMHRIVNHVARPVSLAHEYAAGLGGRRSIEHTGSRLELESPDGFRRALLPSSDTRTTVVDLGVLTPVGIWKIRSDENLADMFAVNLRPAESELRPLDRREFQRGAGLSGVRYLDGNPSVKVAEGRRGTELSLVFLLAALGCIVAEMVLMRGIEPSGGEAPPTAERRPTQVL